MFNRFKNKDEKCNVQSQFHHQYVSYSLCSTLSIIFRTTLHIVSCSGSDYLSGTWEIELPVSEFMRTPPPPSADDSDPNQKSVNDPNSVSNRQCPMVQISPDSLKVISIPLSMDIANPQIHQKYLSSKSIPSNSTRLRVGDKDTIKLILDDDETDSNHNHDDNEHHEDHDDEHFTVILDGNIDVESHTIRWQDGSSWTKQGMDEESEPNGATTPSGTIEDVTSSASTNQDIQALRAQLEMSKEKEMMAKSQTQALMACGGRSLFPLFLRKRILKHVFDGVPSVKMNKILIALLYQYIRVNSLISRHNLPNSRRITRIYRNHIMKRVPI